MEFEFAMTFRLDAVSDGPDTLVERLGAAGCTDAIVGTGQPGRIALHFTREACSAKDAVIAALRDVKAAIPEAELIDSGRHDDFAR